MKRKKLAFDPKAFLSKVNGGRTVAKFRKNQVVYRQGEPADAVFYIQTGKAKKTVISEQGKEAVVAVLGAGDFFGEKCLAGQTVRLGSVAALTECAITRIPKAEIISVIHKEPAFAELFICAPLGPQQSCRGRSGRSIVQFERETPGADPSAACEFWQGGRTRADPGENQPSDARGHDRYDAIPRQFFHE